MNKLNLIMGIDAVGTVVAMCISAANHNSTFDMCVHGLFSWFYVIYYLICQ